ncbi:MAG: DUF4116 domain-containing protein [Clostridium sp.]|nr:DUF4116 domain-containing protein [Clostridium sp.]
MELDKTLFPLFPKDLQGKEEYLKYSEPRYFYLNVDTHSTPQAIESLNDLGFRLNEDQVREWTKNDSFKTDKMLFCLNTELWEVTENVSKLADGLYRFDRKTKPEPHSLAQMVEKHEKQEQENIHLFETASPTSKESLRSIPHYQRTEPVCFAAVNADPYNVRFVPEISMSERIINKTIEQESAYICLIDRKFLKEEHYLKALEMDGINIQHFPEKLMTEENCKKAVENNVFAVSFIPDCFKSREMCQNAIDQIVNAGYINHDLLYDIPFPDIALKEFKRFIDQHGDDPIEAFKSIRPSIINREIVDTALKYDGNIFPHLPEHFQTKRNVVKAVATSGLQCCEQRVWSMDAVKAHITNGYALITLQDAQIKGESVLAPEICLLVEKTRPGGIKTPGVEIPTEKLATNVGAITIPDHVLSGKNVYTFNKELENMKGIELPFEKVMDLYKGKRVNLPTLLTKDYMYKNASLKFWKGKVLIEGSEKRPRHSEKEGIKNENTRKVKSYKI